MIKDLTDLILDLDLIEELNDIALFIFDLDGVVYRGDVLINRSDLIIKNLRNKGIDVVFNTNNSTATRDMYVKKLNNFGISISIDEVYTSAYITAQKLSKIKPNSNVFIIGEIGLKLELEAQGHKVVSDDSLSDEIDFVIVGLDRSLTYEKINTAQKYILDYGAKFYATNSDATLPTKQELLPGAGVMVKAVEIATGQKPLEIFGKPQTTGIELILEKYDTPPDKGAFIGDRIETDIIAGNQAKLKTILVLTGVTNNEMLKNVISGMSSPDIIINSLSELFIRKNL